MTAAGVAAHTYSRKHVECGSDTTNYTMKYTHQ